MVDFRPACAGKLAGINVGAGTGLLGLDLTSSASQRRFAVSVKSSVRCRVEVPDDFPFTKLDIAVDEEVEWCAYNPTFHRGGWSYGIAITNHAVYLFSPFWLWLARWRRYAFSEILLASFHDSHFAPQLRLRLRGGTVAFRTPYDGYQDEMDFDRRYLAKAVQLIEQGRRGI